MDPVRASPEVVVPGGYRTTRFNALRHGVLSRYAVLPWEDESEYQSLLSALIAEQIEAGQERLDVVFTIGAQRLLGRLEKSQQPRRNPRWTQRVRRLR